MSEQQTLDPNPNDEKNSFVCFANLLENFQKGDVSSLPLPHTLDYLLEVVPVSLPILKGRLQALIQSLVGEHASLQRGVDLLALDLIRDLRILLKMLEMSVILVLKVI
eukprot:TRINITY_DN5202_c0_g1_i3.p1 TRINITY_DN5202_c0_g1~~TRINITY_DN5202_c0_g1_i3.p1  ORF type:complete len:108 (-),score=14.73 TRINITY_DN5202_c0_g1_i3:81-404(-)